MIITKLCFTEKFDINNQILFSTDNENFVYERTYRKMPWGCSGWRVILPWCVEVIITTASKPCTRIALTVSTGARCTYVDLCSYIQLLE